MDFEDIKEKFYEFKEENKEKSFSKIDDFFERDSLWMKNCVQLYN